MLKLTFFLVGFSIIHFSRAQNFPNTDILLFDVNWNSNSLDNPVNISNWKGYDNQPFFGESGERIYFTRITDQADIYYYDQKTEVIQQFTTTPESEYSPTLTPDGRFIATIMVERDSSQRLWKYPLSGGEPSVVVEDLKPVGYQAWSYNNQVALFVLGTPNSLYLVDLRTQQQRKIVESIGRSLHHYDGSIYFVHKEPDVWRIKRLSLENYEMKEVIKTFPQREDFLVSKRGKVLMGDGKRIYEAVSGQWIERFDLTGFGASDFNRIAMSADEEQIAVVVVLDN